MRLSGQASQNKPLGESPAGSPQGDLLAGMIIGHSPAIQNVIRMIRQVAVYPETTVLLQGESGTGKDVVARAIHQLSSRAAYQFVPINCAAIPEPLLESELFGVEAGAFTDAKTSRDGYILRANRGTLFLDEIGLMPLVLQAKLLRFLETLSFQRVGGTKEIHVNLRVISATNVDLQSAAAHKAFRDDLFYRLKVFIIYLSPLRERPEDIEPLIEHFLHLHSIGDEKPLRISKEAMEMLLRYPWPGNIRELRSVIQSGQILCDDNTILPKDLPDGICKAATSASQRLSEIIQQVHLPPEGLDLRAFLCGIEQRFLREALERSNGNQVHAAALLRISRDQLRYRLLENVASTKACRKR
ncbi:MAG TPA: sigma-54 dependent transcriptional regulator [Ktedonobacteraceae bacterium]|jgi:two-component system NtrC family response regulator